MFPKCDLSVSMVNVLGKDAYSYIGLKLKNHGKAQLSVLHSLLISTHSYSYYNTLLDNSLGDLLWNFLKLASPLFW